jgi:hypothetical protein
MRAQRAREEADEGRQAVSRPGDEAGGLARVVPEPLGFPAMPLPPQLSDEQRQAALAKAAEARRARADLKEKLKMGSLTLKELLDQSEADDIVGKMKVVAVLESLPGVGKVKARRTMEDIGISETRRVRGLGDQQRRELLKAFPG